VKTRTWHLAASLLCFCVGRFADLEDFAFAAEHILAAFALVEGLARYDAVDLCKLIRGVFHMRGRYVNAPVRMFWKASSTLLASKADVSMKERLFSPSSCQSPHPDTFKQAALTGKLLRLLCGHRP
jgi:hypothetical protein